jgi:hypothetical protein
MNQLYYEKTDVKTIHAAVRVILGGYLLIQFHH